MAQESGIYRVKKADNYFVASNEPFNDDRLSWEARGAMGYLLSKPDGWEIKEQDLINKGPAQAHKVRRMIKELKDCGYIRRYRTQRPDGRFEWISEVYESPALNPHQPAVKSQPVVTTQVSNNSFSTSGLTTSGLTTSGKSGYIVSTEEVSTERLNTETTPPTEKSNVDFSSGQSPETETTEQRPLFADQDDSPSKNGSQQGKAQGQGKRSRSTKPPHPNSQPIMDAYIEALGYTPANYPKEAATAKRMAEQGFTPEQVVATYKKIKEDKSGWWEEKFVSLGKVHEQIGEMYPPARQGANGEASPAKRYTFLNSSNIY